MHKIEIIEAVSNYKDVVELVGCLLIELDTSGQDEIKPSDLETLTKSLLDTGKVLALLAKCSDEYVGVITLHECAAIYAGGMFGEISELYVKPEFRSLNIGDLLINSATEKGSQLGWQRLEVGTPPQNESPRTIKFYERKGFKSTGSRLKLVL